MIPASTRIAWTYIISNRKEPSLATMTLMCAVSIFVSTCALALGMSIAQGFKHTTERQFQAAHASLTAYTCNTQLAQKPLEQFFATVPEITAYSWYAYATVLVYTEQQRSLDHAVILKQVEGEREYVVGSIAHKIRPSMTKEQFVDALDHNMVFIGSVLAEDLGVRCGDTLSIAYTQQEEFTSNKIIFKTYDVRVGGIFTTGLDHYDRELVITSRQVQRKLFDSTAVTHVDIQVDRTASLEKIKQKIADTTKLHVCSWHDQYPAIVAALKLEEYAATLILGLIVCIASMLIFALTFMHLTHRKAHIAVFRAMGIRDRTIRAIFLQSACIISLASTICGIATATILAYYIDTYKIISLPDAYYVSYVPAHMSWYIACGIFGAVIVLTILAVYIPLRTTRHHTMATLLRQER
jgi:ABC-type lipoprotein release transport system permease subunit